MRIAVLILSLLTACTAIGPRSKELKQLYQDDQRERGGDWSELSPADLRAIMDRDRARRELVLRYVRDDQIVAPADRYYAAMVLQHGGTPDDYLLAHMLASAAAFDGYSDGRWLSAATLDRFLQSIQRAQWFDTQYRREQDQPWTMDPRVDWLPSGLRDVYGVPPAEIATRRLREMNGT